MGVENGLAARRFEGIEPRQVGPHQHGFPGGHADRFVGGAYIVPGVGVGFRHCPFNRNVRLKGAIQAAPTGPYVNAWDIACE